MNDPLAPVREIMQRRGATCTPAEFHAAVNVVFHRFESEHYDQFHQDMWESLPQQMTLLAEDAIRAGAPERIRMLDIGSGTGLATDLLLKSPLGSRVEAVDLIDTSAAMLARAESRRKIWRKPGEHFEGLVESLAGRRNYDLVITCSVLHHVPDLESFLGAVRSIQTGLASPGIFLHLQDPNADSLDDPMRQQRESQVVGKKTPEWIARLAPSRVLGRLKREIKGEQGQDYLSKTNAELIRTGVISSPMTTAEIFSTTDFHVPGGGISIEKMKGWLPDYELVTRRSYAFFGTLNSNLPTALQEIEQKLIAAHDVSGGYIGGVWRRRD